MATITREAVLSRIRAGWVRKADTWNVPVDSRPLVLDLASQLEYVPINTAYPMAYFRLFNLPEVFVAVRRDGTRYLVNREGYDYARYIIRLA